MSSPTNFLLAEFKKPSFSIRVKFLCKNWITRILSQTNHPILFILNELIKIKGDPTIINKYTFSIFFENFS